MQHPEEKLLEALHAGGVDLLCTLPCDRVKNLIALSDRDFFRLPLAREEEGVGICAGAAMAGKRPAMLVQSSGVGNMVNALMSLTVFYELPLALFVSWRGIHREGIPAQVPMGRALPGLFEALGVEYTILRHTGEMEAVPPILKNVYAEGRTHAFLLSPALWEGSGLKVEESGGTCILRSGEIEERDVPEPSLTRFEIIEALVPVLEKEVVVCNLGVPSKELYAVLDQPSNFYMLGSMGMATPIGLGVSLATQKNVYVLDGDGSLLMNPGTLATLSRVRPVNLTVLAIDNASYGSTGNQPTFTGTCVDLEGVARGMGMEHTATVSRERELLEVLGRERSGPLFVRVLALSGNAKVENIPLDRLETRRRFEKFLR
jgi:sulfopyruvate decarboxylase subunit beta